MATTVVDLAFDNEKMEFSGSSEDDSAYAKTFWQSVQLLPPMESRLVSSDVKQRLKVAPPGHQSVSITYPEKQEPKKLQAFLAKAKQEEKEEEVRKLHQMSLKKQENQALLEKHRQTRIQKESISAKQKPQRQDLEKYVLPAVTDDDLLEHEDESADKVYGDLDKFEQRLQTQESDSD